MSTPAVGDIVKLVSGGSWQVTRGEFNPVTGRVELTLIDRPELDDPRFPHQGECPYSHSHTRHWCGYYTCRDS